MLEILKELISIKSITPFDNGCLDIISSSLKEIGFTVKRCKCGNVDNMIATIGHGERTFAYVGHTDVVDVRPLGAWRTDPFLATVIDDKIYGRGTADMKGSIVAFIDALKKFVKYLPNDKYTILVLLTSGEEGYESDNGLPIILKNLHQKKIEYCLVGEPSSSNTLGDYIKVGRRGSLQGNVKIAGIGGHVAYPESCENPISSKLPSIIEQISSIGWQDGDNTFPDSSLQIIDIRTNNDSSNVIPSLVEIKFNIRFNPKTTIEHIKDVVSKNIKVADVELTWKVLAKPYKSANNRLFRIAQDAVNQKVKVSASCSTSGGTSDGRYIASICDNIVELGFCNGSIHKANEYIKLHDMEKLSEIYLDILIRVFN